MNPELRERNIYFITTLKYKNVHNKTRVVKHKHILLQFNKKALPDNIINEHKGGLYSAT